MIRKNTETNDPDRLGKSVGAVYLFVAEQNLRFVANTVRSCRMSGKPLKFFAEIDSLIFTGNSRGFLKIH